MSFREYISRVERSAFRTGKTGSFKATFDWLIRPENIAKVLTGKYDASYQTAGKETKERDYNAPLEQKRIFSRIKAMCCTCEKSPAVMFGAGLREQKVREAHNG